jgi:hypothetical protein
MPMKIIPLDSIETEPQESTQPQEKLKGADEGAAEKSVSDSILSKNVPRHKIAVAAGCAVVILALACAIFIKSSPPSKHKQAVTRSESAAELQSGSSGYKTALSPSGEPSENRVSNALMAPAAPAIASLAGLANTARSQSARKDFAASAEEPMIARTISLTILAKDLPAIRSALDTILARHRAYPASLTVNTPSNRQGSFQASLRIPIEELPAALGELKALGRVLTESQTGEEVTGQHADLIARLENSRETEQRLRAILEQRTGKIEDVLEVEEEIARVRGEIESMERQQKELEHRVDFVTVNLELTQELREQLVDGASASAAAQLRNALVAGLRNAGGTVLGVVVFLEEFGPPILIWIVILGTPAFFGLRRYFGALKQA